MVGNVITMADDSIIFMKDPKPAKSRPTFWGRIARCLLLSGFSVFCVQPYSFISGAAETEDPTVERLRQEVCSLGWIAYGARSEKGDWDIFLARPDGSDQRPLTSTREWNEFSPLFSPDGRQLLYRRIGRNEKIDNNHHGTQGELVLANSDGTQPRVLGRTGELPWASWGPDGKQIASLDIGGISIVDLQTLQTVRKIERKGFFQQVTWSPDGKWLVGVANSYGTGWSIARMSLLSGEAAALNRVDCCTPDWFPDSARVVFSWRPPGQKSNKAYGWTQLWMADADGKNRKLLYAEDGRHVYGGHISPDGKYALFTGNMEEDGDPGNAGGPMALMRVADGPIIGGADGEVRSLHPEAKRGPVLKLPAGWEPCWTSSDAPAKRANSASTEPEVEALAAEVATNGWLAYSAKGDKDWDLWLMRPNGTARRKLTDTREYNEAGVRFSPDGTHILYYQVPSPEALDNNTYGTFELVVANSDGSHARKLGKDLPWATWSPDGRQLAGLLPKGVRIFDLQTGKVVRELPRHGIVEQLVWSPDGKYFAGTANGLGPGWNIACLDGAAASLVAISETNRYNCTPDWTPDSQKIVYSRGIVPGKSGFAELWLATRDGRTRQTLYAEGNRHIYGGCISPDGKYALFTRSEADLGKVENSRTSMALIRLRDAPIIASPDQTLSARFPAAKAGPRLELSWGWEPYWTQAEIPVSP